MTDYEIKTISKAQMPHKTGRAVKFPIVDTILEVADQIIKSDQVKEVKIGNREEAKRVQNALRNAFRKRKIDLTTHIHTEKVDGISVSYIYIYNENDRIVDLDVEAKKLKGQKREQELINAFGKEKDMNANGED